MSIKINNNRSGWKRKALEVSGKLNTILTPILQEVLENDMTSEDFFYLVSDAAHMVVLKHNVEIIYKEQKEEFDKIKENKEDKDKKEK